MNCFKTSFLSVVIAAILLLPGCTRRSNFTAQTRIKTVFSAATGYTSAYYYTSDGRLYTVSISNGNKTSYQYTDNLVEAKTTNCSGNITEDVFYYLNKKGLADSMININREQVISSKKFLYDDNGYAIEEREYASGRLSAITKKTVNNGNITSFTVIQFAPYVTNIKFNPATRKNDTVKIVITNKAYTVYADYYPGKIKTLTYENYGSGELGRGSKNLEKKTVQTSSEGDTVEVITHQYAFDHLSRVTSCTTRNLNGEVQDSTYITYY